MGSQSRDNLQIRGLQALTHTHFSSSAATGLTNAYPNAGIAVNGSGALTNDEAFPLDLGGNDVRLSMLRADVTAIAAGATSITWWISLTSAGRAYTNEVTTTLITQPTDATTGAAAAVIDVPLAWFDIALANRTTLYVFAKTNAGTCTATFSIVWCGPQYPM